MRITPLPDARVLWLAAAFMVLLATGLGWWWTRNSPMSKTRRRVWLASCMLLGMPAFLSLVLLEPRSPGA